MEEAENDTPRLEDFHVLQEFRDVFPDEIPGLPPKRDIDFTIEIVPGAAPVSKAPYRMSTPEMLELKMQLKSCWKRSISDRVCLLGEHQFYLSRKKMVHSGYALITDS